MPRSSEAGNALLISMVIVTVIGAVAFGIARTTLSALRQQVRLEDSSTAHAAAVAGIEDGLLRWRFEKDSEAPTQGGCPSPTAESVQVERVNLTKNTVEPCVNPAEATTPPSTESVYDLKIAFRKPPGVAECVSAVAGEQDANCVKPVNGTVALAQDDAVEYVVGTTVNDLVYLQWRYDTGDSAVSDPARRLEAISLDESGNIASKRLFEQTDNSQFAQPLTFNTAGGTKIRFKPYGGNLLKYQISSGPITAGSSSDSTSTDSGIDSRFTTIESTGYFGGTKRKLQVVLDRESGELLPVYDFVLFADQGDINPSPETIE